MKFCKFCKHFREAWTDSSAWCIKAPMGPPEPVYGKIRYHTCEEARSVTFTTANAFMGSTHCGPGAKNYEDL